MDALSTVLPIIFLLPLGSMLRRSRFVRSETIAGVKQLFVNLRLPALRFLAFPGVESQLKGLAISGWVFVLCLLVLLPGRLVRLIAGIKSPHVPLPHLAFGAGCSAMLSTARRMARALHLAFVLNTLTMATVSALLALAEVTIVHPPS